jgi:hypothetical protein
VTGADWLTDDPCPCCGSRLQVADAPAAVTFACGACGWTLTAAVAAPGRPR